MVESVAWLCGLGRCTFDARHMVLDYEGGSVSFSGEFSVVRVLPRPCQHRGADSVRPGTAPFVIGVQGRGTAACVWFGSGAGLEQKMQPKVPVFSGKSLSHVPDLLRIVSTLSCCKVSVEDVCGLLDDPHIKRLLVGQFRPSVDLNKACRPVCLCFP